MNVLCALLIVCAGHVDPPPPVASSNPVMERVVCAQEGDHKVSVHLDGFPKTYPLVKRIRASVRAAEGLFPADFRWTCNRYGHLFVSAQPTGSDPDTFYVTFKPRENSGCGWGTVGPGGPQHSAVFCWAGWVVLHELGHNLGAVQLGAPHSDGTWHCNEGFDVMCYGAFPLNCPTTGHYREQAVFDCQGDDYFNPAPEPQTWLHSNPDANTANSPWVNHGR